MHDKKALSTKAQIQFLFNFPIKEALLGVIGIRDIWVNNYRDTGYLGGKLKGYGIFLKRFWDIEDRSYHFLKESNKFISQYRRRK